MLLEWSLFTRLWIQQQLETIELEERCPPNASEMIKSKARQHVGIVSIQFKLNLDSEIMGLESDS